MRERAEFGESVQNKQEETYAEDCDEEANGADYCEMMKKQQEWEQVQMEQTVLYGARGEGCEENYGEYQMERFENYCEYCETCMYNVYQVWLENGGFQDDDDVAAGDDAKANDDGINPVFYEVCPEYNTCSSYKSLCEEEVEESFTQYFECTQAVSSSGQVGYVGPHCAEDGFTVTLGVYSDEFCNQYIGNGVDISNFIGMEIDAEDDELKPWYNSANGALEVLKYSNEENVCIPCNKADLPYEESDYMEQYEAQNDGNNQDEEDDNRVAQEELSCDFIDSIVMGNYNEMGFVNLEDSDSQSGWLKNNMYAQEYGHYITEVSPLQVFGLVASI